MSSDFKWVAYFRRDVLEVARQSLMGETPNSWRRSALAEASPRVGASLWQCEKTALAWLYETLPTDLGYKPLIFHSFHAGGLSFV
jgi:hypothetical protein